MASLHVEWPALLELMKRRTEVKSLKRLLIKYIAEHVGDYIHGNEILENLPLSLREMVLLQLMQRRCKNILGQRQDNLESVDSMIHAYSQLVSKITKKIELGGFISLYLKNDIVQNITKVLEVISQKATNLEHLDLIYENCETLFIQSPCLEKNSIDEILRMENLKIIHFSQVKYIHVKLVCKKLKKLHHVRCFQLEFTKEEEEDLEVDIEDFKSSFSGLKVFLFNARLDSLEEKLLKLCIQHLPKLEVVKNFADAIKGCFYQPELTVPGESSALRHLYAAPTKFDLPAAFPNVTHLKAKCTKFEPKGERNSILRFARIESLVLCIHPFASTLNPFLEAYGANLQTLIIESTDCLSFTFKRIVDACPMLQELELRRVLLSDDKMPIESFAQLRELRWSPGYNYVDKFEVTNILAAPNLEKLHLFCYYEDIGIDDLRKLTSLVADNKILCKLTSFSLRLSRYINNSAINYELLRALRDFFAVTAVYLPYLVHFKLGLYCQGHIPGLPLYLQSDQPNDLCQIGEKFKEWIGDDSIAEIIRAINVRNQM